MFATTTDISFRHFNKYDFVKAFLAASSDSDQKSKVEKEREAVVIADAIEETQEIVVQNLATKSDLLITKQELKQEIVEVKKEIVTVRAEFKKDLILLEHKLTIKLAIIMASLLTLLPLVTEFLKSFLI